MNNNKIIKAIYNFCFIRNVYVCVIGDCFYNPAALMFHIMFYPRTIIKRTVRHIKGQIVEDVLAPG